MESVKAQSMPLTETSHLCSTLTNGKREIEDISKQLEDELLYGGGDDGEALSDDALSEDSYRLRVSDDDNDDVDNQVKPVSNEENEATKRTGASESPSEVNADSECLQQNEKINDELNKIDSKEEQDFTDDYIPGQDNFCNDSEGFDLKNCPQLESSADIELKSSIDENEDPPILPINSDDKSSVVDSVDNEEDEVNDEEAHADELAEVDETEKAEETSAMENEDSKSNCEDDAFEKSESDEVPKTLSSDLGIADGSDDVKSQPVEEPEVTSVEEVKPQEDEIVDNDDQNPPERATASDVEEKQADDKDEIVNDLTDKESHTEESSDSGIASGGQSIATTDDLSKEPSLNDDESSNSDVKEKAADESDSLDLDCSEMVMEVDSEVLTKERNSEVEEAEAPKITANAAEDTPTKRRLSLVDEIAPKIPCVEEVPGEVDQIKSDAEIVTKTNEKEAEVNSDVTSTTKQMKKATSNDEVIDIEDDNTIDSSSSGISNSVNDNVPSSDRTKLESEIETVQNDSTNKEVTSEKPIVDDSRVRRKRRSTRSGIGLVSEKDLTTRTRREAAQKAEVTVRKNIVTLNNDSDSESSDSTNLIPYNPKPRVTSPSSLKRNHMEADERVDSSTAKKLKTDIEKENSPYKTEASKLEQRKTLEHVRQFFLRDGKQKLKKLTQEELEELFIQKIIETITMRDEIGKLREQAKISERNQEATRLKCQQLTKQIKDFEMVLSRYAADRRNASDTAIPIKINRSVGLQVNFLNDHGVQNLRQIQAGRVANQPRIMPKGPVNGLNTSPQNDDTQNGRRGLKVRSPRRSEGPIAPIGAPVQQNAVAQPIVSTVTPAIPIAKPVDTRNTAVNPGQTVQQLLHTNPIVINGAVNAQNRTAKVLTPNNNKNNAEFIDLTEDGKKKSTAAPSLPPLTAIITTATNSTTVPKVQTRFQRVVPSTTSVTIPQSAIRVVQPAGQPTPTALVNNMSSIGGAPRFLVMQPNGATRQLLLAPNSAQTGLQIRTSTVNTRPAFSNITYASVPSMANGAVRVVPTSGTTTVQLYKVTHPAPLPEAMAYPPNPAWKLPPPAPSLKISKVAHGIVLSWNMALSDKFADIASYQLYAYQEITGMAPSSSNWKKVGDVRALPLPMACTLTQFSEGNNYYFAVRAVDTHSRYGQYSQPGNISL